MKRLALWPLAIVFAAGAAGAEPSVKPDRTASIFRLFLSATDYEISRTELPTLGGDFAFASGINSKGEVVGWSDTKDFQTHAFFWSPADPSKAVDLDPADGGDNMMAWGINDDSKVVGFKQVGFDQPPVFEAFVWQNGQVTALKALASGGMGSFAYGINNKGQIVGGSRTTSYPMELVIWDASLKATPHGVPEGAVMALGRSINELGEVAGNYVTADFEVRAFVWTPGGGFKDLGTLFDNFAIAHGLNGSLWAVGHSGKDFDNSHAFLWSAETGMVELEPANSTAFGASSDRLVGMSFASGPQRAILWGSGGLRLDLGTLSGFDVDAGVARAVNGKDQIAGYSHNKDAKLRATVWTLSEVAEPEPEPELTPEEKIDRLIAQVWSMHKSGRLNYGQANSLVVKLEAAKRQLKRESPRTAANIIRAFSNQVHAFMYRILSEEEGQPLLDAAGDI